MFATLLNIFGLKNTLLGAILSLYIWFFVIVIALFIIKKIRNIGAKQSLIFWSNFTWSFEKYLIKDGELQVRPKNILRKGEKSWTPKVEPENIIPSKQSLVRKINPFRKKGDLIIAVEGANKCITIKGSNVKMPEVSQKLVSELFKTWTKPEVTQFIRKAIAKAQVNRKVFNDQQFYIFLMVIVLNLMLTIMIARRVGLF